MCSIRTHRIGTSGGATLVLSVLLALSLQLRNGSSFVLPVTAVKRCHHASRLDATDSAGSDEGGAEVAGVEEQDDRQAKSPARLTLEGVYKRLKLETQGLADGVVGLESKDPNYGVSCVLSCIQQHKVFSLLVTALALRVARRLRCAVCRCVRAVVGGRLPLLPRRAVREHHLISGRCRGYRAVCRPR